MNSLAWATDAFRERLKRRQSLWLVTGAAGFIGSNLVETLLKLNQRVRGLDNFATGSRQNLHQVQAAVTPEQWSRFELVEADICKLEACKRACQGSDYILHQAALGSVPRSIDNPIATHEANASGFLNMLVAARESGNQNFVYAASSSTYGDQPDSPRIESRIGRPLSPYAVTKLVNELYAEVFHRLHSVKTIGLRYFNVFGPRQDPNGAYAAVIPLWFRSLILGEPVHINGDGTTSRDYCYVENVVQANMLAAFSEDPTTYGQVYNVAFGQGTNLNELFGMICTKLVALGLPPTQAKPQYRAFRTGDVQHSLADISKARSLLGYQPQYSLRQGLEQTALWYFENLGAAVEPPRLPS